MLDKQCIFYVVYSTVMLYMRVMQLDGYRFLKTISACQATSDHDVDERM